MRAGVCEKKWLWQDGEGGLGGLCRLKHFCASVDSALGSVGPDVARSIVASFEFCCSALLQVSVL